MRRWGLWAGIGLVALAVGCEQPADPQGSAQSPAQGDQAKAGAAAQADAGAVATGGAKGDDGAKGDGARGDDGAVKMQLGTAVAPADVEPPEDLVIKPEGMSAEVEARVAVARAAMDELMKVLGGRLKGAMAEGGAPAAAEVCAAEAQRLSAEVAARHGVAMGRTSHKLRNTDANAPRPWVEPWLKANADKPANALTEAVYDLGDDLGVIRPIGTAPMCLVCHGAEEGMDPALKATLDAKYPGDQARGFTEGSLRGLFWVQLSRQALAAPTP